MVINEAQSVIEVLNYNLDKLYSIRLMLKVRLAGISNEGVYIILNNQVLCLYNWSLEFMNTIGQGCNLKSPFYFSHELKHLEHYMDRFYYIDDRFFCFLSAFGR